MSSEIPISGDGLADQPRRGRRPRLGEPGRRPRYAVGAHVEIYPPERYKVLGVHYHERYRGVRAIVTAVVDRGPITIGPYTETGFAYALELVDRNRSVRYVDEYALRPVDAPERPAEP